MSVSHWILGQKICSLSEEKKREAWTRLQLHAVDYHTKMGTQFRVNSSISKPDLLSRVFRDRLSQGDNLTSRVANEITLWQAEPVIECRHQVDGKWIYNCVYDYWKRIKGRFPLLAAVAQQVLKSCFNFLLYC